MEKFNVVLTGDDDLRYFTAQADATHFSGCKSVILSKNGLYENNLFDHTSGSAILLCGDCNGWFETGACLDVLIKGNRLIS